jgi:hypothetical protein
MDQQKVINAMGNRLSGMQRLFGYRVQDLKAIAEKIDKKFPVDESSLDLQLIRMQKQLANIEEMFVADQKRIAVLEGLVEDDPKLVESSEASLNSDVSDDDLDFYYGQSTDKEYAQKTHRDSYTNYNKCYDINY